MKRLLLALIVALFPATGWGQATVLQGGSWTAGQVPTYSSTGGGSQPYVQQSGPAAGTGVGVKELSVIARGTGTAPYAGQGTGQLGTIFQIQDAPSSNATGYHALSFSANAQGGGLIAYNAYGGASPLPLYMNINGATYQFPFALSGIVGPATTVVGDIVCWNNTVGTLVGDCGKIGVALGSTAGGTANALTTTVSGVPSLSSGQVVMVNAATANTAIAPTLTVTMPDATVVGPLTITKFGGQALLPHDIFAAGHRLQLMYTGSGFELMNPAFSITADKINADNLGIGTADDTAIWQLIDTQIGSNAQLPKTVFVSKQTNVKNLNITNIRKLEGIRDVQTFTLTADGTINDLVVQYVGTGPFTAQDVSFTCPIYNPGTLAQPAGAHGLLVRSQDDNTQISNVTIDGVRTTGCQTGIRTYQTMYVSLSSIFNDRPWRHGWVISDQLDTAVAHTRHIRVRDTYGVNAGEYCGSLPVNMPTAITTIAAMDIDVQGVSCDGAGWIGSKYCFDFTTTAMAKGVFQGTGRNCFAGGLEVKATEATGLPSVPSTFSSMDVNFSYYSNFDAGGGVDWVNSSPVDDPNLVKGRGRLFVTYTTPDDRLPSTRYDLGAVFTANGNTYKVATAGVTDGGGGPSGTGNGITDGTAVVDYLQATPATPTAMAAGRIRGLRDSDVEYTFYGTAYGVLFNGTPNNTISNVKLKLTGNSSRPCLQDGNGAITVNRLVIDGSCTVLSAGGEPVFYLGTTSGTTYTDFELKGGPWRQELTGGTAGVSLLRVRPGTTFSGTIAGGVHLISAMGILYNESTSTTLKVGGGGIWEITDSGAREAIYSIDGAGGTITAGTVFLTSAVSSAGAAFDAWRNVGAATTAVYGRFIRGFSDVIPTSVCNSGDTYWAKAPGVGGQPAQGWYCSTPGTTWTAF